MYSAEVRSQYYNILEVIFVAIGQGYLFYFKRNNKSDLASCFTISQYFTILLLLFNVELTVLDTLVNTNATM